jgi:hypothetical protein
VDVARHHRPEGRLGPPGPLTRAIVGSVAWGTRWSAQ